MKASVREFVRSRSGNRCEYCRLPQSAVAAAVFHVEHVMAMQHGGSDDAINLALACDRCNLFKGTNLTTIDLQTSVIVALFNPRLHAWAEHFGQSGFEIVGLTDIGRGTVRLLNMNAPHRINLRAALRLNLLNT